MLYATDSRANASKTEDAIGVASVIVVDGGAQVGHRIDEQR